jgi:hypothetical protein
MAATARTAFSFTHYVTLSVTLAAVAIGQALKSAYDTLQMPQEAEGAARLPNTTEDFWINFIMDLFSDRYKLLFMANFGIAVLLSVCICVVRLSLGGVETTEMRALRDRALNYGIFKTLIIHIVLSPVYETEWILWCTWFAIIGALNLLAFLGKQHLNKITRTFGPVSQAGAGKGAAVLLVAIIITNILLVAFMYVTIGRLGFNLMCLLCVDCFTISSYSAHAVIKYVIMTGDNSHMEARPDIIAYVDVVFNSLTLLVTIAHYLHVWMIAGVSLSLLDFFLILAVRSSIISLQATFKDWKSSRRLNELLDRTFQDATTAELSEPQVVEAGASEPIISQATSLRECSVCLEPMQAGKKLPMCNHVFHRSCLRRYLLEGNDTCPLCRTGITPEVIARRTSESIARDARDQARRSTGPGSGPANQPHVQAGNAWMPRIAVQFVRGAGMAAMQNVPVNDRASERIEARIRQLRDMFPHITEASIRHHLFTVARGNMEAVVDAALNGSIAHVPGSEPGAVSVTDQPVGDVSLPATVQQSTPAAWEDEDSEDIEAEIVALQLSADLMHTHVDRFELVDARKRAMMRRARRDLMRQRNSKTVSKISMPGPVAAPDDLGPEPAELKLSGVMQSGDASELSTPAVMESPDEARAKRAAAALRRLRSSNTD